MPSPQECNRLTGVDVLVPTTKALLYLLMPRYFWEHCRRVTLARTYGTQGCGTTPALNTCKGLSKEGAHRDGDKEQCAVYAMLSTWSRDAIAPLSPAARNMLSTLLHSVKIRYKKMQRSSK